jgi:transcription initiation factor TFIIB
LYEVTKNEISAGKDPMGLAAAVLYLASLHIEGGGGAADDPHKTQKHIAEAAAISAVTLRARYRDLNSKLEEEKHEHHLDRIFN